jgi:hypothetical protein
MKILIIGDSFAADWSVKYNDYKGWPNLLSEKYDVTNLAQPGISEYKILKQLLSTELNYDVYIVSHTSPYRVHTRKHPIHNDDTLHGNADLMFGDIQYHSSQIKNLFNHSLKAALGYFTHHFDDEYYNDVFNLIKKEIDEKLRSQKVISIKTFDCIDFPCTFDLTQYYIQNKGLINHLTEQANKDFYDLIDKHIINITEN